MSAPYRRVGRIQKSHGIKGEVVVALTDGLSAGDISDVDVWVVPPVPPMSARRIVDARTAPRGVIVALEGVDTSGDARDLVGRWLLAKSESLPEAQPATSDVIGYRVIDTQRGYLGVVTDVIITGANDVFVVDEGPFGQVLLPVIDEVVRTLDADAGEVTVDILDGLIDERSDV